MIIGSIKTYPPKYQQAPSYQYNNDASYFTKMPPFYKQQEVLDTLIKESTTAGYVIGARVQRKYPESNKVLGTIQNIHTTFGMAWNYTTGILEPFKVKWDNDTTQFPKSYDYSPDELTLITEETILSPPGGYTDEDYHNFHFAC